MNEAEIAHAPEAGSLAPIESADLRSSAAQLGRQDLSEQLPGSAYLPFHIKAMQTIRVAKDLPQEERKGYPWADGREHQRLMEYAQKEQKVWIRKETLLYDGQPSQQFDQYCDGERLRNITRMLNGNTTPQVREEIGGAGIEQQLFAEPIYGILPLSVYSNGGLLTEATQQEDVDVSLDWDGEDAKLSFVFGEGRIRAKFILWLSSDHDWHPFKLQRFLNGEQNFFSEWEVTRFANQHNQWRVAAATHRYCYHPEIPGPRTARIRYSNDFEILDAKYGDDVVEKTFVYEAQSQVPQRIGEIFISCPVTTDLQRSLLGNTLNPASSAPVCVIVNAQAFGFPDTFSAKSEGVDKLAAMLNESNGNSLRKEARV